MSQNHLFARQYDLAGQELRNALELNPEHALLLHSLGELALARGGWADAVPYLERSLQGPGEKNSHYLAMLGAAYARARRHQDAIKIQRQLDRRASEGLVSAFDMATLLVALGAEDAALSWLERGYAHKDYWLPEMTAWPWFDALRPNARYQALLQNMKLPW